MDVDVFYGEFMKFKARVMPMLVEYEAHVAKRTGAEVSGTAAKHKIAREHIDGGDLDKAGDVLGIERVSKERGHAFDEEDGSFLKRLMAVLDGAVAAGATKAEPMVSEIEGVPDDSPPKDLGDSKPQGDQSGGGASGQTNLP